MERDLQMAEDELGDWAAVLSTSSLLQSDLKKQTDGLTRQLTKTEREMEGIEDKIQKVEKEISESEKNDTIGKTKDLLEDRKQKLNVQWKVERQKEELEMLQLILQNMMREAESQMTKMMDMKSRSEARRQLIRMQLQELEKSHWWLCSKTLRQALISVIVFSILLLFLSV